MGFWPSAATWASKGEGQPPTRETTEGLATTSFDFSLQTRGLLSAVPAPTDADDPLPLQPMTITLSLPSEVQDLLQLHYNFMRPHLALRFGAEVRTPAMQAGRVHRKLSFRDVFAMSLILFLWGLVLNWAGSWELRWKGGDLGWSRRLHLGVNNS